MMHGRKNIKLKKTSYFYPEKSCSRSKTRKRIYSSLLATSETNDEQMERHLQVPYCE